MKFKNIQEAMDFFGGVGATVNVEARQGDDFTNNFTGTIAGIHGDCITVKDQEDDAWDCEPEQLSLNSDNVMHE